MTKQLNIIEKLEVAKACGLEAKMRITPEEAASFIAVFKFLDPQTIAAIEANRRAKEKRRDRIADAALHLFLIWLAASASWFFVTVAVQIMGGAG